MSGSAPREYRPDCIDCRLDKIIVALEAIGAVESATGGNYLLESGVAKVVAEIISGHEECHAKEVTLGYLEEMAECEPLDRYLTSVVRNLLAAAKKGVEVQPNKIPQRVSFPVMLSEIKSREVGDRVQKTRVVEIPFLGFLFRMSITRLEPKKEHEGNPAEIECGSTYDIVTAMAR